MDNKIKIYLDDMRTPLDENWMVVRDYKQFVSIINLHGLENISLISLDHDLGDSAMAEYYNNVRVNYKLDYDNIVNEKTGLDCAKFLVRTSINRKIPLPKIQVHSANPIGASNIIGYINNFLKNEGLPQDCIRIKVPHTV